MQVPRPPTRTVDCEPEAVFASTHLFHVRNKKKPGNFIHAEITSHGFFKYHVENMPKGKRGCPGKWLFEIAWDHFQQCGAIVTGIRGDWTFGDNLDVINRLTVSKKMAVEVACRHTWAYDRARSKGFTSVMVIDVDGNPGNYNAVDVLFLP